MGSNRLRVRNPSTARETREMLGRIRPGRSNVTILGDHDRIVRPLDVVPAEERGT